MIRILVIDDDINVRESVVEVLSALGYQTLAGASADEGLSLAVRHVPDLVISDIMMPGKDGYTLLSEFREHEATSAIPFILMTGVDSRERFRAGMNLGADDYLPKPFTGEQLQKAVQASLTKHRLVHSRADEKVSNLLSILENTLPHELRTPLNGILGFSEILKTCSEKFSQEEVVQAADYINISAKRLHRLVENVLLSARLRVMQEAGATGEKLRKDGSLNLMPLIKCFAADAAERYKRTQDLVMKQTGELLCSDPQLFCKAFEEVVDNAFKFSDAGSKVWVTAGTVEELPSIVVQDQGRGMDADQVSRIDLFRQFDRSHFEQQGAGLGLFIAKQVVNELGGSFEIESRFSEGTTVALTLPLAGDVIEPEIPGSPLLERVAV